MFSGTFDVAESQMYVGGLLDMSLIFLIASHTKTLRIYDLTGKIHESNSNQTPIFKSKTSIDITDEKMRSQLINIKVLSPDIKDGDRYSRHRANVIVSPKKDYFIVVYRGEEWIAYVYSINIDVWNVKYIGPISPPRKCTDPYPAFGDKGEYIVYYTENKINVVSPSTLEVIQEHEMSESVKDVCVSVESNNIAILLSKNILVLKVSVDEKKQEINKSDGKNQVNVIFQREVLPTFIQQEVVVRQLDGKCVLEEVNDLVGYADTDRVTTASRKRQNAISKTRTPNGLRTIHYHAQLQVLDTKTDQIEYTPKKTDLLLRTNKTATGVYSTETIKLSDLLSGNSRQVDFTLLQNDKIVNDNNKVKYRISNCDNEQFKIQFIPSVLTIYSVEEQRLSRKQSITVHRESLLTASNCLFVTFKATSLGNFINIYDQNTGNLQATHSIPNECHCAQFSLDQAQLLVVDSKLQLTKFEGPLFNSIEQKVEILNQPTEMFEVKGISFFGKMNHNSALICYIPNGPSVFAERRYVFVDLKTKIISKEIVISPSFEDISEDGMYGIDGNLYMYKLSTGNKMYKIAMNSQKANEGESMNVIARIWPTNQHIVYVNKQNGTLHIASISGKKSEHLFSCYFHSDSLALRNPMNVINNGRHIILRGKGLLTCFSVNFQPLEHNADTYTSEIQRALLLSRNVSDVSHSIANAQQSMFFRKQVIIDNAKLPSGKNSESVKTIEFNRDNPEKPQVLIICEPVMSTLFQPEQLSAYLITEKRSVTSIDNALTEINSLPDKVYDAIVFQLVTNNVNARTDEEECFAKISQAIDRAKCKGKLIFVVTIPIYTSDKDINRKIETINLKLCQTYSLQSLVGDVYSCSNNNLFENGRPVQKYFQGGVLSEAGVKQVLINIKEVMMPLIAKNAPSIQTSGNKQLYNFWSKFM